MTSLDTNNSKRAIANKTICRDCLFTDFNYASDHRHYNWGGCWLYFNCPFSPNATPIPRKSNIPCRILYTPTSLEIDTQLKLIVRKEFIWLPGRHVNVFVRLGLEISSLWRNEQSLPWLCSCGNDGNKFSFNNDKKINPVFLLFLFIFLFHFILNYFYQ